MITFTWTLIIYWKVKQHFSRVDKEPKNIIFTNSAVVITLTKFDTLDKELLPIVYKQQVTWPRIWKCYLASLVYSRYEKKVEGVQCRTTKVILELRDKPYQERLRSLNLYSMEYRRKRGDLIQAYKILKKLDRIDPSKFFIQTKYKATRSHSMKLFKHMHLVKE